MHLEAQSSYKSNAAHTRNFLVLETALLCVCRQVQVCTESRGHFQCHSARSVNLYFLYLKGLYFLKILIVLVCVYLYAGMHTYGQVLARGRQGTGIPVAEVIGSCELLIVEHGICGNLNLYSQNMVTHIWH